MDVGSYCDQLDRQLIAWKARVYDVIQIVDKLPDHEKEWAYPKIRGLHAMMEEIDTQLEQLKTACPADWSPNRKLIDEILMELKHTLNKLSRQVNGPLIPDSLGWVSD